MQSYQTSDTQPSENILKFLKREEVLTADDINDIVDKFVKNPHFGFLRKNYSNLNPKLKKSLEHAFYYNSPLSLRVSSDILSYLSYREFIILYFTF